MCIYTNEHTCCVFCKRFSSCIRAKRSPFAMLVSYLFLRRICACISDTCACKFELRIRSCVCVCVCVCMLLYVPADGTQTLVRKQWERIREGVSAWDRSSVGTRRIQGRVGEGEDGEQVTVRQKKEIVRHGNHMRKDLWTREISREPEKYQWKKTTWRIKKLHQKVCMYIYTLGWCITFEHISLQQSY